MKEEKKWRYPNPEVEKRAKSLLKWGNYDRYIIDVLSRKPEKCYGIAKKLGIDAKTISRALDSLMVKKVISKDVDNYYHIISHDITISITKRNGMLIKVKNLKDNEKIIL